MDRESVKKVITSTNIENATLKETSENYVAQLKKEGEFITPEDIKKIEEKFDAQGQISQITSDLISRAYLNWQKAKLIMIRADAYAKILQEKLKGKISVPVAVPGVPGAVPTTYDSGIPTEIAEKTANDYSNVATCENTWDCQKLLGYKIINIAASLKPELNIDDAKIISDTGSKNFECLVLQVAMQESSLRHCKANENKNPLYCDGVEDDLTGSTSSFGIMQINKEEHGAFPKFEDNVKKGVRILNGYLNDYSDNAFYKSKIICKTPKYYSRYSDYNGWKRALRIYNGLGCNPPPTGTADVDFVENVLKRKQYIESLFPECKTGASAGTATATGTAQGGVSGTPQTGLPKGIEDNPTAGSGQTVINILESALGELEDLVNQAGSLLKYDKINPNKFSILVDGVYRKNLLTSEEYNLFTEGKRDSGYLRELLNKKLETERQTIKNKEQCVQDANWVSSVADIKINPSETISPGMAYIKLNLKSIDICKGYTLVLYNPEIFGSPSTGYHLDQIEYFRAFPDSNQYYIQIKVDAIKKGWYNYDPNKYTFKIYNSENQEVFVGTTITVDTNPITKAYNGVKDILK